MKKIFVIFGIVTLLIMFVFAESNIDEKVGRALEKKGINASNAIVEEVNLTEPPEGIILEDIDDTNIAVYSVHPQSGESFFVVTAGGNTPAKTPAILKSKQFLNFGFGGSSNESGFLKTITGANGGLNKGYVMMNSGDIIGVSTNLEIENGEGELRIIIYKNGEAIGFGNSFVVSSDGVKNDYDIQSEGIVTFEAGDVISVYLNSDYGIEWQDVTTIVEISVE